MVQTDLKRIGELLGYRFEPRLWPSFGSPKRYYHFYTDGSGGAEHTNIINKEIKAGSFFHYALMDSDKIPEYLHCFSGGVCLFCLNKDSKIRFERDMIGRDTHLLTALRDDLNFPVGFEDKFEKLCEKSYDFREFLNYLRTHEEIKCNIDSALFVYDLQGDEAVFHILCHVFTKMTRDIRFTCPLLHGCDIQMFPEISSYASGTTFPVVVSPFSKKLRWQERNNGWFLETELGGEWFVLDCLGVGHYNMGKESMSARKQYWAVGGDVVPYVVCWNWLDIVEAVGRFGTDVLVRDFRTGLFDGYWFKFGPNALIDVKAKGRKIGCGGKWNLGIESDYAGKKAINCTMNLKKEVIREKTNNEPCFSADEAADFFELGELCMQACRTASKK